MKKVLVVCALIAATTGCSSIVSQSEYAVSIASNPADARFVVTNKAGQEVHSGMTPDTVTLKASSGYFKSESYVITFQKEGYPDKSYALASTVDGWYFGNILFGGLLGMLVVDPATGAMYKLPKTVDVELDQAVSQESTSDLTIATLDSLSEEQRSALVRVN